MSRPTMTSPDEVSASHAPGCAPVAPIAMPEVAPATGAAALGAEPQVASTTCAAADWGRAREAFVRAAGAAARWHMSGAVQANVRRHVWRAVTRVAVLCALDVGLFLGVGAVLRVVRPGPTLGPAPADGTAAALVRVLDLDTMRLLPLAAALLLSLALLGTYGAGDRRRDGPRVFAAAALAAALVLWGPLWHDPGVTVLRYAALLVLLATPISVGRWALDAVLRRWAPHPLSRAIVVGKAEAVRDMWAHPAYAARRGVECVGWSDTELGSGETLATLRRLGSVEDLPDQLADVGAETLVVAGRPADEVLTTVTRASALGECNVLLEAAEYMCGRAAPRLLRRGGAPFLELRPMGLRGWQLVAKRALDLVGAGLLLVLVAPVMAIVAGVVRRGSRGPVVFGQVRLGQHGRAFRCLKFRSMYPDAEQRLRDEPALWAEYVANDFKLPADRDPRITPVGRWLRKTSLDELPQLWNVLRGDMSLVGPRPIVPDELSHYRGEAAYLLLLKPGITGLWQVSGRSALPYPDRTGVELEYVEHWSLWSDVGILLRTIPAVLRARGAH